MKKREFLAMGGAVPLVLAGCGGDSTGSAPVRLVNASVGYANLGFMVESTQATSADVAYGSASPFETVQAGAVSMSLTQAGTTINTINRTLNKDSRYSLIAFGYKDELGSLLLTESTVTPDTGKANVGVLNTSVDVGLVDVYLTTTPAGDLGTGLLVASAAKAGQLSSALAVTPLASGGKYYITVIAHNTLAGNATPDVRFQSTSDQGFTVAALDTVTIIITPGVSGTLANVIVLTQGTGSTSGAVSFQNSTARLRVVTAVPDGTAVNVAGLLNASDVTGPAKTGYAHVAVGAPPAITFNSTPITLDTTKSPRAALAAGGDYTLAIYANGGTGTAVLFQDDNTTPLGSTGVKFSLLNLAYDNTGLVMHMTVNSKAASPSSVKFASEPVPTEVAVPQNLQAVLTVYDSAEAIFSPPQQPYTAGSIFTQVIVSVDTTTTPPKVRQFMIDAADVVVS